MNKPVTEQLLEQREYQAFFRKLDKRFGEDTAHKVCDFFDQMELPIPVRPDEFMVGTEGSLIFAEDYGCVIRVEFKETALKQDRIDHPLMIQPLGRVEINNAAVEIVPGTHTTKQERKSRFVRESFEKQGLHFWDDKPANVGILPKYTVRFPLGIPVSIDRGSVNKVFGAAEANKDLVEWKSRRHTEAAAKAQKQLYGAIQSAFDVAVHQDPKTKDIIVNKMAVKNFWEMCKKGVEDKKLVAGWTRNKPPVGDMAKQMKEDRAVVLSANYKKRLDGMKK